nr:Zys 3 [Chlamydomonas reinhardtii]
MLRSAGRVAAVALLALFALGCVSAAAKPSTDRLVAAIKSKNLSAVVDALSVKGLDVNTPDSTRRLPLVEAARSRDARLVGALLDQGALARVSDGTTTPLHLSMQGGSAAIVKLLLAHGADPNAKDKTGASARSTAAAVKELADLLKQWDARGAMAFEDEPGAWIREERDGQSYYWKPANGESRWAVPPSCAWQRVTVQGHPIKYINSLTGQETTRVPPALAWARVTAADGSALWLNWASRVASAAATAPAELPAELAAELSMHPNRRWYNTATREYVYTDPAYATPWRELVDEASGAPFFFNVETGDTTWELPAALAWTEVIESSSGADGESGSGSEAGPRYFHNTVSGEVAWSAPEGSRHVFVEASAADL